jgi:hypothetical protein
MIPDRFREPLSFAVKVRTETFEHAGHRALGHLDHQVDIDRRARFTGDRAGQRSADDVPQAGTRATIRAISMGFREGVSACDGDAYLEMGPARSAPSVRRAIASQRARASAPGSRNWMPAAAS